MVIRHLGLSELEFLALAALAGLGPQAHGVAIANEIKTRTGRAISVSSLYKALRRLEERRLVDTTVAAPMPLRGGRAKKLFRINAEGHAEFRQVVHSYGRLLDGFPFTESTT